jgi:hypothetical protein
MRFQFSLLRLIFAVAMFAAPFALLRSHGILGRLVAFLIAVPLTCVALTVNRKQLGPNLLSIFKTLCYLFAPSILALLLAPGFVNATPPGGVNWPYYVCLLPIPAATYWYAGSPSVAICYGFASGIVFAWPVFIDGRTPLRAAYGHESEVELLVKTLGFAALMTMTCSFSYRLRMRRFSSQDGALHQTGPVLHDDSA